MKENEIKHVLDSGDSPTQDGKELVFTHYITGVHDQYIRSEDSYPSDWDNVRHLTGNLYYAWDNTGPDQGAVFIGELVCTSD